MMLVYLDWKGLTAVGIFLVPIGIVLAARTSVVVVMAGSICRIG